MNNLPLVLASTSPFRRELLGRLGIAFICVSPGIDETPLDGEAPEATALRLAQDKALAVRAAFPRALIIGSDQVAVLDGELLSKPGSHENAKRQLRAMRGKTTFFHTAVALHNGESGNTQLRLVSSTVSLRELSDAEIERYLLRERPYECAGSAKIEGLGIALIKNMQVEDPTALIGLPLITLVGMLKREGVEVP